MDVQQLRHIRIQLLLLTAQPLLVEQARAVVQHVLHHVIRHILLVPDPPRGLLPTLDHVARLLDRPRLRLIHGRARRPPPLVCLCVGVGVGMGMRVGVVRRGERRVRVVRVVVAERARHAVVVREADARRVRDAACVHVREGRVGGRRARGSRSTRRSRTRTTRRSSSNGRTSRPPTRSLGVEAWPCPV